MATIQIDYDEGDQASYRGVIVSFGSEKKAFSTGDPVQDFFSASEYAHKEHGLCLLSSSVDHFVSDGDAYRWAADDDLGEFFIDVQPDERIIVIWHGDNGNPFTARVRDLATFKEVE